MSPASLTVQGDIVVKRQSVEATRKELDGLSAAKRVASESGLFDVPTVLDAQPDRGEISMERIRGADTLRRLLPVLDDAGGVVALAAAALARIHRACDPPLVHGDFTIENVMYRPSDNRLFIIDWAMPSWLPTDRRQQPLDDVAMFLLSLFNRPILYRKRIKGERTLADRFLDTYPIESSDDLDKLQRLLDDLLALYLPYYRKSVFWRYIANRPSIGRVRRYLAQRVRAS